MHAAPELRVVEEESIVKALGKVCKYSVQSTSLALFRVLHAHGVLLSVRLTRESGAVALVIGMFIDLLYAGMRALILFTARAGQSVTSIKMAVDSFIDAANDQAADPVRGIKQLDPENRISELPADDKRSELP